ncbi:hypothetical protein PC122_g18203 [Phytophthora cactorum]|nr:hypothetical protein PC122_g18203 [Phytophthora cactorum]
MSRARCFATSNRSIPNGIVSATLARPVLLALKMFVKASGSPSASDNKVELTSLQHPWRGGTSGKRTCIRIEQFALLEKVNMIAADVQEAALSSGKATAYFVQDIALRLEVDTTLYLHLHAQIKTVYFF